MIFIRTTKDVIIDLSLVSIALVLISVFILLNEASITGRVIQPQVRYVGNLEAMKSEAVETQHISVKLSVGKDVHLSMGDAYLSDKMEYNEKIGKLIKIENTMNQTRFIYLTSSESVEKFIDFEENEFILTPGEARDVYVYIVVDKEMPGGNYTGEVLIHLIKTDSKFYNFVVEQGGLYRHII